MRRDVRTVRRWEKSQGLPVHRHQHQKAASVYAYRSELDLWWKNEKDRLAEEIAPGEGDSPDLQAFPSRAKNPKVHKLVWSSLAVLVLVSLFIGGYLLRREQSTVTSGGRLMIAVLPFQNLTGEAGQEFVSDGFTEEMIAQLSQVGGEQMGVIARTSAMAYKGTTKPVTQIGRELNVDYVLEGSVRRWGDEVRVTAQLINVHSQTHIWAENFASSQRDILVMQSDISHAIARQIHVQLLPPAAVRAGVQHALDPEAHELYLKGLHYLEQRNRDDLEKSTGLFTQAIAKDPKYAAAYAGLADAYNLEAFYGLDTSLNSVSRAKIAADKALELDGSMAAAHAAEAYTDFMWQGDWPAAEREFRRALELDDNYVPAHQWYALYLAAKGRTAESVSQMQYAKLLDPLSPSIHAGLAYMSYFARNYAQAIESAQTALKLNAQTIPAHTVLGWVYIEQKNYPAAITEFQTAAKFSGNAPVHLCGLARALALSGKTIEARRILDQLARKQNSPEGAGTALASGYLAAGDQETALHWLEITNRGDIQANWLRVDPAFDSIRENPRFVAVINRIGSSASAPFSDASRR
ncbi:MAG TPA: tetratricopeptide repeat protein [Candidatus Angelobacter sp.]